MQRTIFNKNGQIAFTFYMYENMQNAEWKVDEGEKWADPSLAGEKGLYPDSIKDYQKHVINLISLIKMLSGTSRR